MLIWINYEQYTKYHLATLIRRTVKNISITLFSFTTSDLIESLASLSIKNHEVMLFEKFNTDGI